MDIGILLIGIEYRDNYKLNGTINDVINYYNLFNSYYKIDNNKKNNLKKKIDYFNRKNFLIDKFINKFKEKNNFKKIIELNEKKNINNRSIIKIKKNLSNNKINLHYHILTDNIDKIKNKLNNDNIIFDKSDHNTILKYLDILSNEFKYIHICYSGHGSYITDLNNDEIDKRDECIVPSDYKYITDDILYNKFIKKLKITTKCRIIMDCCNSGTIFDLQYINNKNTNTNKIFSDIIVISGCRDKQYSYELFFKKKNYGALTYNLNKIINSNLNLSDWYMIINEKLNDENLQQNIVISSSKDIIDKKFMLIERLY
jgi:hypothetical protein